MARKASAVAEKAPARKKTTRARTPRKKHAVKLGRLADNGISPSMYGLVEHGASRRPKIAKELRGTLELRFSEDFAPVRVVFAHDGILVEDVFPPTKDEKPPKPDLVISGSLPQIVHLASAPLFGGVPRPTNAHGRAALANVAGRKVKIEGSPLLARRVLKLLEI